MARPLTRPHDPAQGASSSELASLYGALSHELRSPLGSILNFAAILELDHGAELGPGAREVLARIRRSADSAVALLEALGRVAAVERAPLHCEPLDLQALARATFAQVPHGETRAELALGELPVVVADRELVRAAFEELFANAIKFSASREKAVVSLSGWTSDDDHVVLCVSDAGIGFDPRHGARLFKLFERLHSRATHSGAGVGLALVRRVAERHGGRVWAEAEPDAGARFYMELPACSEADA